MTILVTGANGQLGRLVVSSLLERGVPAAEIVATARTASTLDDLAAKGVVVRQADYSDPASLRAALVDVDKVLLISSSEIGQRAIQHQNVIDAAVEARVKQLVYTSIAKADTSTLGLAGEHLATEKAIIASGLPYVLLRNGWYIENYTPQLPTYLEHGIAGAAGDGKVSAATRADFAEAAAAVLTSEGQDGKVYELGGEAFTMTELAAVVSTATGKTVTYTNLPEDVYAQVLVGAGLPEVYANLYADSDRGAALGDLYVEGNDLEVLIGHRPTTIAEAVAAATA